MGPWIFPPFNFLKIGTMEFALPVPISQCTRIGKTFDLSLHGSQRTFSNFRDVLCSSGEALPGILCRRLGLCLAQWT